MAENTKDISTVEGLSVIHMCKHLMSLKDWHASSLTRTSFQRLTGLNMCELKMKDFLSLRPDMVAWVRMNMHVCASFHVFFHAYGSIQVFCSVSGAETILLRHD